MHPLMTLVQYHCKTLRIFRVLIAGCADELAYAPGGPDPLRRHRNRAGADGGRKGSRVGSGDVLYFSPGEKPWHGAGPDTFMVHLVVNPASGTDGGTDWLAAVTDEEYEKD